MKKEEFKAKNAEKLRKEINEYAAEAGIKLNPDENVIEKIVNGLLINKKEKGESYCPCRILTGDKKKDEDIICPCVFHRGEIETQGHCFCLLFVK